MQLSIVVQILHIEFVQLGHVLAVDAFDVPNGQEQLGTTLFPTHVLFYKISNNKKLILRAICY